MDLEEIVSGGWFVRSMRWTKATIGMRLTWSSTHVTHHQHIELVEQNRGTHTGFAGHTGGNDDDIRTGQGFGETIVGRQVTLDFGWGGDVGEIGGDTGGVDDIV